MSMKTLVIPFLSVELVGVLYIIHAGSPNVVIEKAGFGDVVVWNPWIEKAKAMSDFGDNDYKNMVFIF